MHNFSNHVNHVLARAEITPVPDFQWLQKFNATTVSEIDPKNHEKLLSRIRYECKKQGGLNEKSDPSLLKKAIADAVSGLKEGDFMKQAWMSDDVTPSQLSLVAKSFKIEDFVLVDETHIKILVEKCKAEIEKGRIKTSEGIASEIRRYLNKLRRRIVGNPLVGLSGGDRRRKRGKHTN